MGGPTETDQKVTAGRGGYDLEAGTMVGEYRVEGPLGSGGMGRVYAATHPVIAKRAAIKVLHPELSVDTEAVERFIQEARSVNQIGHPNIVDIFAFGELPDGRSYFVMEWLRGQSLRDRLRKGMLPMPEALQVLDTIAVALEAAHEKGIVHRDLKPDNIFLVDVKAAAPQVKLLDFGIAKLLGTDEHRTERTRTGNLLGTPAYISPEQARGHHVDHRTDIYALGALAYELMTGQLPFPSDNAADMIAQHLYEAPPHAQALNAQVSPELDACICAMLAKDANARPTLDQIRAQLRAYFGQFFATGPVGPLSMRMTSEVNPYATPPPGALSLQTRPGPVGAYQTAPGAAPAPARSKGPMIALIAAIGAVGVGVAVFLALRGGDTGAAKAAPAKPGEASKASDSSNGGATKPAASTSAGSDGSKTAAGTAKPADSTATAGSDASKPVDATATAGSNATKPVDATATAGSNAAKPADSIDAGTAKPADSIDAGTAKPADATNAAANGTDGSKKKPKKPVVKKPGPKPADDDDAPM